MAQFDDNEEMATLTRWWSRNGTAAVVGIVLGLIIIGGWYGWNWYSDRQDAQAAHMFAEAQHGISSGQLTGGVKNIVSRLEDDYSGTPYAGAAALSIANYYVDQQQYEQAAKHLDWAMHNAEGKGMRQIATVRKARVLWAQNKPEQALALLQQDHPAAFGSLYAELAGDIQVAQGNREAAHKAYKKAMTGLSKDAPQQMLQHKIDQTAPVSASNANPSDSKKSDS